MILIVDDNQENIFSLKSLLEIHKFPVDTAMSGVEALKKILTNPYALIILDVQMPEMDGFEVAEAISGYSKSKDIPIIFLSAVNTHKKFITKGYTSGGYDYVTKPFDPDILLLKIKTFYRLSEQTRQLNEMEKSLREEIERRKEAEAVLEKRVEERTTDLRVANRLLEESNRELKQFAFVASHDLQEPLRKIQTFSSLALEKYFDDKERVSSYLGKIFSSASRLRNLITDLLEYSRVYADDQFTSTDMNELMQEVLSDLDLQVRDKDCMVDVQTFPVMEVIPTQMHQLFQNLLSNSLKFRKQDEPCRINITVDRLSERSLDARVDTTGPYCRIVIRDNGVGFKEEYANRMFEIFQRLNHEANYEGTGIGLAIVKKVVERHEGIIDAHGKENEGATFTIVLPIHHVRKPNRELDKSQNK